MLALCSGSAQDQTTRNMTLFNVFETLRVPPFMLGQSIPAEVHFSWLLDSEALGKQFEFRLTRVSESGAEDPGSILPFDPKGKLRWRIRTQAIRLPHAFGSYRLRVQWRLKDTDEWVTEKVEWPLDLLEATDVVEPDPGEPASDL